MPAICASSPTACEVRDGSNSCQEASLGRICVGRQRRDIPGELAVGAQGQGRLSPVNILRHAAWK